MSPTYLKPEIAAKKLCDLLRSKGITDERVLDAFMKIPRHRFVDAALYEQAYDDNALPIGLGQTISQPYIVAYMTQMLVLANDQNQKILEIGTGSGFQAAVLAHFSRRVFSVERHKPLSDRARLLLRDIGFENIVFKVGDGTRGWPQYAPFDRIIVTAGAPVVPEALVSQLSIGGRMIIPSGGRETQKLEMYVRKDQTTVERSILCEVAFVPLIGDQGWQSK